jgi:RNA polymerase sigma-70 factor (ECF subfamily)
MWLLHSAADAEEVVQQTNLVLWQKFDDYDPAMDFVKWACGIARYEVLKFREKQPRDKQLFSDRFLSVLAAKSEPSVDLFDARRHALQCCLKKLAEGDRRLVLARYQPNATTATVAESLGRSVQGTRKALRRIRGALLACVLRTLTREGRA